MEYTITFAFKKVKDADTLVDFLVDNGIDPDSEIELLHIKGKHIVNYVVDDMYVDPEEAIGYDVDFLENERIKDYSISLDGKECKH